MPIEDGSSTRMGGSIVLSQKKKKKKKNIFVPKNLNKLFQVFGLGLRKHFELETEVIIFTITLSGNEKIKHAE